MTQYILATSHFRSLTKLEKAVEVKFVSDLSLQEAADACGVSKSQVFRSELAVKEGRDIGTNGRPNHFNKMLMDDYIRRVKNVIEMRGNVTNEEAIRLVIFFKNFKFGFNLEKPFYLEFYVVQIQIFKFFFKKPATSPGFIS